MVRVLVLGASGSVGKATLESLTTRHPDLEVFAGVRDPSKFDAPNKNIITVVKANVGDQDLATTLKEYQRLFIVTPGSEDRLELGINAVNAAKTAGVEYVLLLSVLTADTGSESIFGRQFLPLEEHAQKELGEKVTIIRLPIFVDNFWGNAQSIKEQGTFYDPRDPTKPHTPVIVSDVAKASADLLANPASHGGKVYSIVSPPVSLNDIAAAFSKALGKDVTPTTVPYTAAKEAFLGFGFAEWQADGILELYKYIDAESQHTNTPNIGDFELITGEKSTTVEDWVEQVKGGFA